MVPEDDALSSLSGDLVLAICLTLRELFGAGAHGWGNALQPEDKNKNPEHWAIQIMYVTSAHSGKQSSSVSWCLSWQCSGSGTKWNTEPPRFPHTRACRRRSRLRYQRPGHGEVAVVPAARTENPSPHPPVALGCERPPAQQETGPLRALLCSNPCWHSRLFRGLTSS